ncbi:MAG: glycosyltransferase [Thermoprotei archaeon]
MRVLFINSLEPNHSDFYFLGLKKLLGEKNVVEYPYKPLYHCYIDNGILVAKDLQGKIVIREEPNYGTVKYDYAKDWQVPKIYCLLDSGRYVISDFPEVTDYDLIICNFLRGSTPLILKKILFHANTKIPPIIFIDGEDDFYVRSVYKEKRIVRYFKREILIRTPEIFHMYLAYSARRYFSKIMHNLPNFYNPNLYFDKLIYIAYNDHLVKMNPLNMTIPDYGFNPNYNDKIYDISFVANLTSPLRIKVYYKLLEISRKYKLNSFLYLGRKFATGIPWSKYVKIIAKSKLSVSVPGGSFDTARYWEIPYHGTALISWEPWIKIPNNFIDGESAIFFRKINELEKKILDYLKSDKWETLARNGRKHFLQNHTPEKRAEYILSTI